MDKYKTYLDYTAPQIQELVKRDTPKQLIKTNIYAFLGKCPNCHNPIPRVIGQIRELSHIRFCYDCGQRLKHKEEKNGTI